MKKDESFYGIQLIRGRLAAATDPAQGTCDKLTLEVCLTSCPTSSADRPPCLTLKQEDHVLKQGRDSGNNHMQGRDLVKEYDAPIRYGSPLRSANRFTPRTELDPFRLGSRHPGAKPHTDRAGHVMESIVEVQHGKVCYGSEDAGALTSACTAAEPRHTLYISRTPEQSLPRP
jgi:hypothetical protein